MKFSLNNNSWKTSLGGILSTVGAVMLETETAGPNLKLIGKILFAIGPLIIGLSARDNDKSSEQVGVSTTPQSPPTP